MRFLEARPAIGWSYWALNGGKWINASGVWEDETYGLLTYDYSAPRSPYMIADLRSVANATGAGLAVAEAPAEGERAQAHVEGSSPGGWGGMPGDALPPYY